MSERTCIVEGCDRQSHVRAGWCNMHYYRVKKYGTPDDPGTRRPRRGLLCSIEGCDRDRYSGKHGWCKLHYDRHIRHGDPLKVILEMGSGDDVTGSAIHKRVTAAKGKASDHPCISCAGRALHWAYDHSDPSERVDHRGIAFGVSVDHYQPMCVPCHKRFDLAFIAGQELPSGQRVVRAPGGKS